MIWKIVGVSEVLVIYIYIYSDEWHMMYMVGYLGLCMSLLGWKDSEIILYM